MDPKRIADMDQALKMLADSLPPFLWSFKQELLNQGFKEEEASKLVAIYLFGACGGKMVQ